MEYVVHIESNKVQIWITYSDLRRPVTAFVAVAVDILKHSKIKFSWLIID
jgi:hypothetical protein